MSAPSSALGTEYLFELWEVMPPSNAPGSVVLSTAPIYSDHLQTMLNYGITEPPLQLGWKYVWRVRAYDLRWCELFRSNGYSVICIRLGNDKSSPRQSRQSPFSTSTYASSGTLHVG